MGSKDIFFSFLRANPLYEELSIKFSYKKNDRNTGLHLSAKGSYDKPIKMINRQIAREIILELEKVPSYKHFIPKNVDTHFLQEFLIFREKIKIWEQYCSNHNLTPFDTPLNVIKRSLLEGPEYADYLKKYLAFSIRKTLGINYWTDEPSCLFVDINQIFPPQHLMNFVRPKDFKDIIDYSFKKPSIKGSYEKLQFFIRKNLKKNCLFREFDLFDQLDLMDEKGSFEKGVSSFNEKIQHIPSREMPSSLMFRINSIHKTPCESRVIAIAEPSCKAFLKHSRKMYKQLLNCKYDYYGKSRWDFEGKLHERSNITHLLFDQKKCGWTFPMELLELLFLEIKNLYPHIDYFNNLYDIFQSQEVYYEIEGKKCKPKRGFTLGMFDDAVSFIISCMFEMYYDSLELVHGFYEKDIDGLFFGDDCDIIFKNCSQYECEKLGNRWILLMDQYGISINLDKSFYSKSGIFCEVYGYNNTKQMLKHVTYLCSGLKILGAYNTAHAKNLFNSWYRTMITYTEYISRDMRPEILNFIDDIKQKIIGSFPVEFIQNEHQFPFEVGGWFQFLEEGKNLLLEEYFNGDICHSLERVYEAQFPKPYKFLKDKEKKFFKDNLSKYDYWKDFRLRYFFDFSEDTLFEKYCFSLKKSSIPEKMWWDHQLTRKKLFLGQLPSSPFQQRMWNVPFTKMKLSERCFLKIDDKNLESYCRRKPEAFTYKDTWHIDKKRAQVLATDPINQGENSYFVKYDHIIPFNTIYACLDLDLAKCKYIVPLEWWHLCKDWNISIEKFFNYLYLEGFDPLIYRPLFYKRNNKETVIEKIFDIKDEFIVYCNEIASFITLTRGEILYLDPKLHIDCYQNILKEKVDKNTLYEYQMFINKIKDLSYWEDPSEEIIDLYDGYDPDAVLVFESRPRLTQQEVEDIGLIGLNIEINPVLQYVQHELIAVTEAPEENFSDLDDFYESEEEMIEVYPGYFIKKDDWDNPNEDLPNLLEHDYDFLENVNRNNFQSDSEKSDSE